MFHVKHRQIGILLPMICRFLGYEDAIAGEEASFLAG
jgi:hypothetical protein